MSTLRGTTVVLQEETGLHQRGVPASVGRNCRMATNGARAKDGDGPRTRGGWTPAGTAAARRAARPDRATPRGDRTREELVEAARRVFERDGFVNVRVADIVAEAGV